MKRPPLIFLRLALLAAIGSGVWAPAWTSAADATRSPRWSPNRAVSALEPADPPWAEPADPQAETPRPVTPEPRLAAASRSASSRSVAMSEDDATVRVLDVPRESTFPPSVASPTASPATVPPPAAASGPVRQPARADGGLPPGMSEFGPPDAMYGEPDEGLYAGPPPGLPMDFRCPLLADRLWVRTEYLLWWSRHDNLPPLITTSPTGTDPAIAGVLGHSTTSTLFGDDQGRAPAQSGGRFTLDYWFNPPQTLAVELEYTMLGKGVERFQGNGTDTPILARPFDNLGVPDSLLIAYPGVITGSVTAEHNTDFQSGAILLRRRLYTDGHWTLDALAGYRYNHLAERLTIDQSSTIVGVTERLFDQFETTGAFHGVELGLASQSQIHRLSLEWFAKLALGTSRSSVTIDGFTVTGGTVTSDGGLLAQPSNMGQYQHDEFALVPQAGLKLGYDFTDRLRATVGYTFMYWSRVARPGDQIDFTVDFAGGTRPAFDYRSSGFWAQGLNLGLEFCF